MLQTPTDLGTKKETREGNHQKFIQEFFKEPAFPRWTERVRY